MLFNSFEFLLFFPVVTLLYFFLPHPYRWIHLLISSCIFYMAFIPAYILILFFTIIVDYYAGLMIEAADGKNKKAFLILSIVVNVGILAVFKYYNFFIDNVNALLHSLDVAIHPLPLLGIILPIGLSFHTFQAMSYTIEVYRGNQKAERHLGIYALYVMFYPQLVAGPIERPQNILHQFREKHDFEYERVTSGLKLMAWGLFKKVVIADRLAIIVDAVYLHPTDYNGISLILTSVFFAFQIYCDFSGYSDIAIGSARVMGFSLMKNFNTPFSSKSVTEFWRRWHISLSTWFNDYLFTPFVIAKRNWGKAAVVLGLLLTFFLSGLWHGAGWTFIIYGCLHGAALSYEFLTKKFRKKLSRSIPSWWYDKLSVFATFGFVSFSWIFFRSKDLKEAWYISGHLFSGWGKNIADIIHNPNMARMKVLYLGQGILMFTGAIALILFLEWMHTLQQRGKLRQIADSKSSFLRWAVYYALVGSILLFGVFNKSQFIYFQF